MYIARDYTIFWSRQYSQRFCQFPFIFESARGETVTSRKRPATRETSRSRVERSGISPVACGTLKNHVEVSVIE